MNFTYTARSTTGELLTGMVQAESLVLVRQQLREKGLFVTGVKATQGAVAGRMSLRPPGRKTRVPKRELVTFTSQLAVMSRSGIDLAASLKSLHAQTTHPALKAALERVYQDVAGGKPVSAAMSAHSQIFTAAYVASIAAGEASGRLPEILTRLSKMLRDELRRAGNLKSLLAYPVILAVVSAVVVAAMVLFVLPEFSNVFDDLEMPLPAITRLLLDLSQVIRGHWLLVSTLLVAIAMGWRTLRRTASYRRWWDSLTLKLLYVRDITRALSVGRAMRLLGTMIESGIPLLDALRLTRSSMTNSRYQDLFSQLEQAVLNGREIGPVLADPNLVPAAAAQMVVTGERTGTLASVTQTAGEFYEEEGEARLKTLATLLEPAIIIVMGLIVAGVVLSVMLPIFDFATMTQRGP